MTKKPILIQTAMEIECQEILKHLNNLKKLTINNYTFYQGTFLNYPIIISLSKVGLIHASSSLTIAIKEFNPKIIINTGIAGATSEKIHTKDIIIGTKCLNINSYKTPNLPKGKGSNPENWELLTFLSGMPDRLIIEKATPKLIELTTKIKTNIPNKIYQGTIGSGDVWNQEVDRIINLNKNFNILVEDMEAISTYTIANTQNIPVISIKIVSDNILTNEPYNRTVGKLLENYILEYLKILINE